MAKSLRQLIFSSLAEETGEEGHKCTLCLAPHTQMSVPTSWKNVQAQEIAYTQLHLTQHSPVCRLCRDDIRKLLTNPANTPRWEKLGRKANCCIDNCTNVVFVKSKVATSEQVSDILDCENVPYPTPLCKHHYHTVSIENGHYEHGFLSFLRLVGVVYMKKHASGFSKTPEAYSNECSVQGETSMYNHQHWLDNTRQCICDRIQYENEMIPNTDSLYRHWKRVCWVLDMWGQADGNTMTLNP